MRALALGVSLAALLSLLWFILRDSSPSGEDEGPTAPAITASSPLNTPLSSPAPSRTTPTVTPDESRSAVPPVVEEGSPWYVIRGRVVACDGRSSSQARVRIWEEEDSRNHVEDREPYFFESELLRDGAFDVLVDRPGEFRVWGSAKGECSSDVVRVTLNPARPEAEVELRLPRGLRIRGKVIDGVEGKPVANVTLCAFVDVERFGGGLPEGLGSVECRGKPTARSGEDGSFELFPVDPRAPAYVVQARRSGVLPLRVTTTTSSGKTRLGYRANFCEVSHVAPGSEGVVVTLGEAVDTMAHAELQLISEGGAKPPPRLSFELLHVGPRGSVFSRQTRWVEPSAAGCVPLPELLPGARYQVIVSVDHLPMKLCTEPFVAHLGNQIIPLALPFSVEIEIEVRDAQGALAEKTTLKVLAKGVSLPKDDQSSMASFPELNRLRYPVIFSGMRLSTWPARFLALPGTYVVQARADGNCTAHRELVVEQDPVRLVLELSR